MPVEVNMQVGPQQLSDGVSALPRLGKLGDQIVTELHPRYYEQTYRGAMFSAANQSAQAVSVALATTYTGLCLYNPVNSGKNLSPPRSSSPSAWPRPASPPSA
jgi:hypothetical protein